MLKEMKFPVIPGQFSQFIADNFDHNVRTLDRANAFHGMGIIAVTSPGRKQNRPVLRIKKTVEVFAFQLKIKIHYHRAEIRAFQRLKYEKLSITMTSDDTWKVDFTWKIVWPLRSPRPLWSGMMQTCHEGEHPGKPSITFLPMIDMDPSDMSCVYSTLVFVCDEAFIRGVTPVVIFVQPLWW